MLSRDFVAGNPAAGAGATPSYSSQGTLYEF
ncbi:protein of unknown function [Thermococcus nautili]|nr:protein of unknown function [Thermococcus nautili]